MAKGNKNLLTGLKRHKFLILVIFLGLLAVVIAGVQAYQRHQNKLAFQQARTAIDEVYKDIVTKVGPPAASKSINSCQRHNQEFEEGPLSCAVGISFIYSVANREEANKRYKAIQSIIKSRTDLFKPDGVLSSEIRDELVFNTYYHSAYDRIRTKSDMECSAKYIYDTPDETFLRISEIRDKTFQVNIGCSDWAKQKLYPLNNS
jgi:hypothetical protein